MLSTLLVIKPTINKDLIMDYSSAGSSSDSSIQEAIKKIDTAVQHLSRAQDVHACSHLRLAIDILKNCEGQEAVELLKSAEKKLDQLGG